MYVVRGTTGDPRNPELTQCNCIWGQAKAPSLAEDVCGFILPVLTANDSEVWLQDHITLFPNTF